VIKSEECIAIAQAIPCPDSTEDPLLRTYPDRKWCAIHTRARHEKKVAAACSMYHLPNYLPLRMNQTFSGGRLNTFHLPMFPGYVFAALRPGDISELKRTNSVAQKLEPEDQQRLLVDLINIRRVELAHRELTVDVPFQRGQAVMVTRGPLTGVKGMVVRYKNSHRLQVAIEAIKQVILVDVAKDDIAPLDSELNPYWEATGTDGQG
jgi:transcription antitermination factor NusG